MFKKYTGEQVRQEFIEYFKNQGHTFVPSSPLVPGGDQTLLFTNAGMVQFKDIFLGTDKRAYTRAVNSQKCMRVAGKHNDLDDVGRDDSHHTFFEMLGNWSFGDYYKKEAIGWAWELLTEIWKLPKDKLWVTCFKDDIGNIPQDDEAADIWRSQPGMISDHILFFGRKDNFWEMAETGPCGPCSEIHLDRGPEYCEKSTQPGHVCGVNMDCQRFLELWNLVFIQYLRSDPTKLDPLPSKHVDTGMGLERIVSVLQNVSSNYKTDLLFPIIETVQHLTGNSDQERDANITPYRVIADHSRAATFLIADGVVPGNVGRNYICRMIIRRAARFGSKIGLKKPFLAKTAETVIELYGSFYPELNRNKHTILNVLTREENRFIHTLEGGLNRLETYLDQIKQNEGNILTGEQAFELYATFGLPFEITRDIAQEHGLTVDQIGFNHALEEHRIASSAGTSFGELGGEDVNIYRKIFETLKKSGKLDSEGVLYSPYSNLEFSTEVLALVKHGKSINEANYNDEIEMILPSTSFYIESGGQVSDTGEIISAAPNAWKVKITGMRKPAAGLIVHIGKVIEGTPTVGDIAIAHVDQQKRYDTMRNHTATHLLHHHLRSILGEHARQAGSLVAPDRLRFDFTHPEPLIDDEIERIETAVNNDILNNYKLNIEFKPLQQAIDEGAIALFGEKYENFVRNIKIGEQDSLSNELCGGTHVEDTGDIGFFIIISESSAAAGIRRIEAVTGRSAFMLAHKRMQALKDITQLMNVSQDSVVEKTQTILSELNAIRKQYNILQQKLILTEFDETIKSIPKIKDTNFFTAQYSEIDIEIIRQMADRFRQKYPENGVVVLASVINERPTIIAAITNDLIDKGLDARDLVQYLAQFIGGSGGGKPMLAQAGGKDSKNIPNALKNVSKWLSENLK